jgi:hypothetical protein
MDNEELQAILLAVLEAGASSQPAEDGSLSEEARETMSLLLGQLPQPSAPAAPEGVTASLFE